MLECLLSSETWRHMSVRSDKPRRRNVPPVPSLALNSDPVRCFEDLTKIYLEKLRWNGIPKCPKCGYSYNPHKRFRNSKPGYYRCCRCQLAYSVKTGTIFEHSHIPLNKWFMAIYLIVTNRKGISSLQLSHKLSIKLATAWFMRCRILENLIWFKNYSSFLFEKIF